MKPKPAGRQGQAESAAPPADLVRRMREIEIKTRKVVSEVFSGEYHSAFKGRGMEFSESRPYQPGDDIRTMDWNVTARAREPFVKVFREERELTLMLLVDLSASGAFGSAEKFKSEVAAEICATLAFSAIKNNDKVGLLAFTDRVELFIAPKKGRTHVLRLIRDILFFEPEGKRTDISFALEHLNMVIKKKAIAFLVSDFRAEGYDKALKATAKKHDLIVIRIVDPRERQLPDIGYITLRDAETGETITVNSSNDTLRKEYEAAVAAETAERDRLFASAGADQVVIQTDRSYIEPLIRFFKIRERRVRF